MTVRRIDGDVRVRPARAKGGKARQQPARGQRGRATQRDRAIRAEVRQTLRTDRDERKRFGYVRQIVDARRRERNPARLAHEQFDAERLFEADNTVTDRARRDVQFRGGELETLMPAGRLEETKRWQRWQTKRHGASPKAARRAP
jgi:hypothetical protein